MVVLGICGGHDANWCVFKDGKLIGAFEKERFSRIRHDDGYIMDLVDETLAKLGIKPEEVSLIATSEANFRGTDPGLEGEFLWHDNTLFCSTTSPGPCCIFLLYQ